MILLLGLPILPKLKERMQNNILASLETAQHEFRRGVNKMLVLSRV
jgi:hypothetical protein